MNARGLRIAKTTLIVVWLLLIARLMIADVWDETNGMVAFSDPSHSLWWKVHFVLTQSLGFYRPIPSAFAAAFLHVVRDFAVSWRVLRFVNAAMLLGALALFAKALTRWNGEDRTRDLLLTVALLFSGSAIITAGWYANIFDASTLLLIAAGTLLLSRGRDLVAGAVFGIAFFCKETAILSLPLLLLLFAAGRLTLRQTLRAASPAVVLGAIYFFIRSRVIAFGSATDTHGFQRELFLPTLVNTCESFWRQTLKGHGWGVVGFAFLVVSLLALRKPRVIAAAAALIGGCAVIYWQMVMPYQDGQLITHLDFIGRLYLVPVSIFLFVLLLEKRTWAVAVLVIPIVAGGWSTYRDHERFQRTYKRIYTTARTAAIKPLRVDYAEKPLHDPMRGIEIGAIPDAPVRIEPTTGRLIFR